MLYVGTYSMHGSEGIYALRFDHETGALVRAGVIAGVENPSFLALHPDGGWLYSVSEGHQGAVAAIALNAERSSGSVVSRQSTLGSAPCHLAVDPSGQWLVAANYGSGTVALHPINSDGSLSPASNLAEHSGSGPRADRQEGPHAHSATFDPLGRFVIAADLGIDRLMVYALDRQNGKLVSCDRAATTVAPGSGPRHFVFHPSGEYAYLINELANTVVAYRCDADAGVLNPLQTLSTLPPDFIGESYCADIHAHPSGRFVYGSNRGHDSLAVFRIDSATGLMEAEGHISTGGRTPRNFAVTADGRWLLAANQDADNIVVFRLSDGGGRLEQVGEIADIPAPVCLVFSREG